MAGNAASVPAIKVAVWLMVGALASANCAFASRVLVEQPAPAPAKAPLPADPLPAPTEPPADPVVMSAAAPAGAAATGVAAMGNAGVAVVGVGVGAAGAAGAGDHPLTFFMHDIFPIQGAVPLPQGASNLINGNNVPYVAGLGATSATIAKNNGNTVNGGNKNIPFLTEGHELGAAVIGRAQGFYVASSQDGNSKTIMLTAMFDGEGHGDTLSFFGVHRMAEPESHVAIIGGTGKYENAKGFAAIQTLHPGDEHTTDGVETPAVQHSPHLSSFQVSHFKRSLAYFQVMLLCSFVQCL
ncbi:hypothetical protein GUJ93_ZPchr0006g45585 [Zizania palustris]|uniref:Dirigent protein n=1 Tax=Zizania palustris TaxID=103762 RepID=A0A8J5SY70_ZIZPA|nr:hypothetical protein GUJ93_ZPchr0006g45585 [Zizania palustris]